MDESYFISHSQNLNSTSDPSLLPVVGYNLMIVFLIHVEHQSHEIDIQMILIFQIVQSVCAFLWRLWWLVDNLAK